VQKVNKIALFLSVKAHAQFLHRADCHVKTLLTIGVVKEINKVLTHESQRQTKREL